MIAGVMNNVDSCMNIEMTGATVYWRHRNRVPTRFDQVDGDHMPKRFENQLAPLFQSRFHFPFRVSVLHQWITHSFRALARLHGLHRGLATTNQAVDRNQARGSNRSAAPRQNKTNPIVPAIDFDNAPIDYIMTMIRKICYSMRLCRIR